MPRGTALDEADGSVARELLKSRGTYTALRLVGCSCAASALQLLAISGTAFWTQGQHAQFTSTWGHVVDDIPEVLPSSAATVALLAAPAVDQQRVGTSSVARRACREGSTGAESAVGREEAGLARERGAPVVAAMTETRP